MGGLRRLSRAGHRLRLESDAAGTGPGRDRDRGGVRARGAVLRLAGRRGTDRDLPDHDICDGNLGSITGFPFGHYHFVVGADLVHVGIIPIIVGPLWFGMGYFAWIVAG